MARKPNLKWAVPSELDIPPDPLHLRVDFHEQAVVITDYEKSTTVRRIVSAMDIAHALARDLTFGSGILPKNTLWWSNTAAGPLYGLYEEPKVRRLAILFQAGKPPKRYNIPLPGLIFICRPGHAPSVFAVKRRPSKKGEVIYRAPFLNMSDSGTSCGGNNDYPTDVGGIPESFFLSFFTSHGDIKKRSVLFPENIIRLWEWLDKSKDKTYPLADLVPQEWNRKEVCTIGDLISLERRY